MDFVTLKSDKRFGGSGHLVWFPDIVKNIQLYSDGSSIFSIYIRCICIPQDFRMSNTPCLYHFGRSHWCGYVPEISPQKWHALTGPGQAGADRGMQRRVSSVDRRTWSFSTVCPVWSAGRPDCFDKSDLISSVDMWFLTCFSICFSAAFYPGIISDWFFCHA